MRQPLQKKDRRGSLFGGLTIANVDSEKILLQSKINSLRKELKDETLVNPAAVHNNLANALMSSNKIMEAIPHYKQALALDTNDAAAYMNLGVAFKHLNQFDKALEYFEKSLELRPTADEHYNMANTFIKLVPPNHEKAIFHYKHALRLNPQHANCHQNLGLMFKSKGMIDAAILEMREAVKCNDDADFRYNLGNALYAKALLMDGGSKEAQTKILEEAVQSYLRAIAMKADDPDVRTNLGITLMKLGNYADAVQQYLEVMKLQPGDGLTHYNCGNALLMDGNVELAIEKYRESLILMPEHKDSAYNLGMALMRVGEYAEACTVLEDFLERGEDTSEREVEEYGVTVGEAEKEASDHLDTAAFIYYNLGTMYSKLGKSRESIDALSKSIEIKPDNAYAHLNLGHELASSGDDDSALKAYREATVTAPKDAAILRNYAYVLVEQNNLVQGIEWLQKVLELSPEDGEIKSYLEQCQSELAMSTKIDESIKAGLESIANDGAKNVGARANLALAYKAKGCFEEAILHFQECLNIQPGHPQIENFLKQCIELRREEEASGEDPREDMREEEIVKATGRFRLFAGKKKGRKMSRKNSLNSSRKNSLNGSPPRRNSHHMSQKIAIEG